MKTWAAGGVVLVCSTAYMLREPSPDVNALIHRPVPETFAAYREAFRADQDALTELHERGMRYDVTAVQDASLALNVSGPSGYVRVTVQFEPVDEARATKVSAHVSGASADRTDREDVLGFLDTLAAAAEQNAPVPHVLNALPKPEMAMGPAEDARWTGRYERPTESMRRATAPTARATPMVDLRP